MNPDYAKITDLVERIRAFNTERDWSQFHNPKDLAISLSLEAGELLEHFQWKNQEEMQRHLIEHKDLVASELADILYWVLIMGDYFKIDLVQALNDKMDTNESKYPSAKHKGKHNNKYNEA